MFKFLTLVLAVSTLAAARPSNLDEMRPRRLVSNVTATNLESSSGLVSTPNYPNNYDNNLDRVYRIQSDGNSTSFTANFYVCDCYIEENSFCSWDYIQFGYNSSQVCGSQTGRSYSAESRADGTVDVVFHSDYVVTTKGCLVSYGIDETRTELMSRCPQQSIANETLFDFTLSNSTF